VREEFIHPLIVHELQGWLSDPAETIVAVDLASAIEAIVFSVNSRSIFETGDRGWMGSALKGESFAYAQIATSPSGVEIVECSDRTGGTGVFGSVGLFSLECDRALGHDREGKISTRARILLKSLGSISLGDRVVPLRVNDNHPDFSTNENVVGAARTIFRSLLSPNTNKQPRVEGMGYGKGRGCNGGCGIAGREAVMAVRRRCAVPLVR
jgi:hypothetical protein